MRTDPAAFAAANVASIKEPRFVVRIDYASPVYITSHVGISGVSGTVIDGALLEPSIISQRLNPIDGRSEIGSASFSVVDLGGALTDEIRSRLGAASGLRDKQVAFFLGYAGLAFSDFVLVGTQRVTEAQFDKGRYQISCADIQRSAKKDIFELAETTLAQSLSATDTTVAVSSTAGFTAVFHGPTYSDAANTTVGYVKIRDEVIRYTGKTATTFTGCTRGVLGTIAAAYEVDAATPAARREKVTEHVYLELPAVKIAYAILTGQLYGDAATLPASWHLGIDTSLIRTSDFTGIGGDLWDGANAGVVIRFEGLKKTDGKKFLEEEICRLLGVFMPVYADGAWGLRRAARVLSDAATVATLDESNSVQVGELVHDMDELHNVFRIFWNWNGSDYTRTTALIDATSAATHGKADPLDLKFKGLYGGRATDSLIYQLVDALRDRYAAPPQRLTATLLHSLNRLEVGDVVRVRYASVRDFAGAGASIDRAFEIQNISVNHRTGAVQLELFGSTAPASALSPTTATTALPDAFYTSAGSPLSSVATITAGVMATGTYTLAGGSDLTAAGSIWYHAGDLTIPQGTTLNISGNVQLRIRGYLTVNGTINGTGGGLPGVADDTNPQTSTLGNPGWVGNSRGWDGIDAHAAYKSGNPKLLTLPVPVTQGKHASFPHLQLQVSGNALTGIPTDLRGTGGGPGGSIVSGNRVDFRAAGGTGAAGGAGLCTISRGFSTGASATINLSGNSSVMPPMHNANPNKYYPGAGGAGGPGSMLLLLDGSAVSAPDLTNRLVANTGSVPIAQPYLGFLTFLDNEGLKRYDDNHDPWAGYADPAVISERSLAGSCLRIQFVPAPETATADPVAAPPSASGLSAVAQDGFVLVSWTLPADPASYDAVEIFASTTNDRTTAVKVFDGRASDFKHILADQVARFYWARTRLERAVSAWHPATTTSSATAAARPPTVTGYLTNEAVAVAADSAGSVASFAGASGAFKVSAGAVDVTTSATFSLFASSNLTATINASTGAYSATAMAADVGTATFRASYGGVTVDKVFTVTKARAGVNGSNGINGSNGSNGSNGTNAVSISLSRDAVQLFAFAEGTVPSFADAAGLVTVRDGATDVTASATLSAVQGSGVTGTVNTATNTPVNGQPKGYYRVTAMTGDTGTLTLSAVYGGVTYQATFTLAKNKTGYEIVTALPSTNLFAGRMVYLTGDGKLYRNTAGTFASWTAVVASSDISGQLADSQIASLGAGKVTGQLTNAQIADLAAAKVTGQLVDSQLAAIAAAKVTGQLVASQLNIAIGGANLIANSGFEVGGGNLPGVAGSWAVFNGGNGDAGRVLSCALDTTVSGLPGDYCQLVSIVSVTNGTDTGISQGPIRVLPSQPYVLSAYVLPNVASKVYLGVRWYSDWAGYNTIRDDYTSTAPANVWTRLSAAVTAPANAQRADLFIRGITAAGEDFRVDGVQLEQASLLSAYAPRPDEILDGTVTTTKIADNAVSTPKLVANAVVAGKIAANAVGATEIQANAITTAKLAADAVTASKIAARSITAERLALGALDNLAPNGNLTTGDFSDWRPWYNGNEVLAAGAAGVPAGAPANYVIRLFSISGAQQASIFNCPRAYSDTEAWKYGIQCRGGEQFRIMIDNAATGASIGQDLYLYLYYAKTDGTYNNSVYAGGTTVVGTWATMSRAFEMPADAVAFWPYIYSGSTLAGGSSVYVANLRVIRAASAELIVDGAVIADKLAANAVTAAKIAAGAVVAGKIAADAVTANELAANAVTTPKLSAGAVVADKIAADAITANKIAAGAVTAAKLSVSSLDAISANVGTLTAGVIRNTADTFRVDVSNGRTVATTGSYMKVTGAPFGSSSQFIEWYGPYQANLANCTESNAVYYLKTNGTAYFGGALLAGVLKNSVQGTNLTDANEAILGPFSTNGGNITLTMALNFYGRIDYPGTTTGLNNYNAKTKQNPSFTVVLSRKIGGGSYSDVATYNFTGSWNGEAPVPVDSAPGYYEQEGAGSGTYTDTSGGTADKTFKLRFTSWANVNSTVIANTLSLTSVE